MSDRTNIFAGTPLDRNAERRDDADWAAAQRADPKARALLLGADDGRGRRALVHAGSDALRWLDQVEIGALAADLPLTYLGHDEIGPLYSLAVDSGTDVQLASTLEGRYLDLRSAGARLHAARRSN